MVQRPARLWKDMATDTRVRAAEAFWRDTESQDIQIQHAEALNAMAQRFHFRLKSVQALPVERRARQLAQLVDVSDAIATRALIAYHFACQRPLMSAFLDALGAPHENGLITEENFPAPPRDTLEAAVGAVSASFDRADVALYLHTLMALDAETWGQLDGLDPA
jgi:hypothetical protein